MKHKKRNKNMKIGKYVLIGSFAGGVLSAMISSPQSQIYWWKATPENRANIFFWDTFAISTISFIFGWFFKKDWLKWLSAGIMAIGLYLTFKLKENPYFFAQRQLLSLEEQ
jgi:hypothetical protein